MLAAALAASLAAAGPTPARLEALEAQARQRVYTTARAPLAPLGSEALRGVPGPIPNDVRAVALAPNAVRGYAKLLPTFVYEGTVEPETKLAMGLRIAQINGSPYVAAHAVHRLRATDRGKQLLDALRTERDGALAPRDELALAFASALTREVHGLSDPEFAKVRGAYNDSQVVELTFVACLFNYLTRFAEALSLPVEPWVLDAPAPRASSWTPAPARIALLSNEEALGMAAVVEAARNPQGPTAAWGLGVANSIRAMMRVPALAAAWRGFGSAAREQEEVSREIKLHVSFAVSMANGCRYCTLHQVLGLRRLGVNPTKLMAMKKEDAALSKRELVAVTFARELTRNPGGMTDAGYQALRAEFGERGALEVLMQTCNFAFMNRFTDGLRLPSEDEAVRVYRETYGGDYSSN
jgi:AhpD family alkylhydroperoxidase